MVGLLSRCARRGAVPLERMWCARRLFGPPCLPLWWYPRTWRHYGRGVWTVDF